MTTTTGNRGKRVEQKIFLIKNEDYTSLYSLLKKGWVIKNMSSCAIGYSMNTYNRNEDTYCYCLLEKYYEE